MSNFFLIDHSLKDSSGHHCDYVQCVATAAKSMGFATTLGTNRLLRRQNAGEVDSLGCVGTVRRVFRHSTYQPDSYLAGLRHLTRSKSQGLQVDSASDGYFKRARKKVAGLAHRRRREKFVRQFALDCGRFFQKAVLTPSDHTFFTTVSELELMGLAVYLASQPRTMQSQWHLQFHFNLFDGRPPEYEEQQQVTNAVRSCFAAAMSRLSYHAINFYTTSDELAEQYNRLGVGTFEPLPYPIATEFRPEARLKCFSETDSESMVGGLFGKTQVGEYTETTRSLKLYSPGEVSNQSEEQSSGLGDNSIESNTSEGELFLGNRPIKITCPGGVRREKGHVHYLQPLVNEIWEPYLATGKAQLVLQRAKRNAFRKQKVSLSFPNEARPENSNEPQSPPVVYCPHPLSHSAYVDLIKSSDIGPDVLR